jgi:RNA polymerase sigma-70 factor (ECF subfamily)
MREHRSESHEAGIEPEAMTAESRPFDPGAGDRRFAELLRAMADLQPMARRWTLDQAMADDLLQDTAERALRHAGRFVPGSNATAWVRTIMYRLAIDETRRRRRDRSLVARYGPIRPDSWEPAVTGEEATPEEEASPDPVTLAEVWRAADRLDARLRTVFRLWAVDRLSYRQIALRLQVPLATVGTRLLRARRRLQEILQADRAGASERRPREGEGDSIDLAGAGGRRSSATGAEVSREGGPVEGPPPGAGSPEQAKLPRAQGGARRAAPSELRVEPIHQRGRRSVAHVPQASHHRAGTCGEKAPGQAEHALPTIDACARALAG